MKENLADDPDDLDVVLDSPEVVGVDAGHHDQEDVGGAEQAPEHWPAGKKQQCLEKKTPPN